MHHKHTHNMTAGPPSLGAILILTSFSFFPLRLFFPPFPLFLGMVARNHK